MVKRVRSKMFHQHSKRFHIFSYAKIYNLRKLFRSLVNSLGKMPECPQPRIGVNGMTLKWVKNARHLRNIVTSQLKDDMDIQLKRWQFYGAVNALSSKLRGILQDISVASKLLSHPGLGWLYVFSSFPPRPPPPRPRPPPQQLLPLASKPFELNLRYLAQKIYGSGEMYWMTFLWPWPNVTAVALISKNLLVCTIKWESLIRSLQNVAALLP